MFVVIRVLSSSSITVYLTWLGRDVIIALITHPTSQTSLVFAHETYLKLFYYILNCFRVWQLLSVCSEAITLMVSNFSETAYIIALIIIGFFFMTYR